VSLSALLVQIARGWDLDSGQAAWLITIMSIVGMAGSVLFGSVADRIGGAKTLMILTASTAALWVLLAQRLPYPALVAVLALQGLCAAGAIPNLSRALAEIYGRANFSRAFGLATTIGLPLNVAIVPLVPFIEARTGSYVPAMLGIAVLLAFAFLLSLYVSRRSNAPEAAIVIA
jgi:MFS family permease